MAKLGINQIDVNDIPEQDDFSPLPPDNYVVMITESEMKPTNGKNGAGEMLVLKLEVQEGQFQGRTLFDRLNIVNPNSTTEEIAYKALGAICRAVGLAKTPDDSEQLHNKRLVATVKVDPAKPYTKTNAETGLSETVEGRPQNRIVKYLPIGAETSNASAGTSAAEKPVSQKATSTAAATKGKTPPWKK